MCRWKLLNWNNFLIQKIVWKLWKRLFFVVGTAVKFRNLQISKILKPIQTQYFQFLSRLCTYLWDMHGLKNNSVVSRCSYFRLLGVNQKFSLTNTFIFFLNWRYFPELYIYIYIYIKIYYYQIYVKIPSLLLSVLRQSTESTRLMHIYMGVGVLLLHFQ